MGVATPGAVELAPELQTALRRGELALRDARSLARVPVWEQVSRWETTLDKQDKKDEAGDDSPAENRPVSPSRIVAKALREFDHNPEGLADALHGYLGTAGVHKLLALLTERADTRTLSQPSDLRSIELLR